MGLLISFYELGEEGCRSLSFPISLIADMILLQVIIQGLFKLKFYLCYISPEDDFKLNF